MSVCITSQKYTTCTLFCLLTRRVICIQIHMFYWARTIRSLGTNEEREIQTWAEQEYSPSDFRGFQVVFWDRQEILTTQCCGRTLKLIVLGI